VNILKETIKVINIWSKKSQCDTEKNQSSGRACVQQCITEELVIQVMNISINSANNTVYQ